MSKYYCEECEAGHDEGECPICLLFETNEEREQEACDQLRLMVSDNALVYSSALMTAWLADELRATNAKEA